MIVIILISISVVQFVDSIPSQSIVNNYEIFPNLPRTMLTPNTECMAHYQEFLSNLANRTLWAYQIQDATATSATGVLSGSSYQLGNFDQCLQAQAPFTTKYCLVEIRAEIQPQTTRDKFSLYHDPYENVFDRIYPWDTENQLPINLVKLGWCMPASCTTQDLEQTLDAYLNESQFDQVSYHGMVDETLCHRQDESIEFEIIDIVFVSVLAFLIFMVLWSTIYESTIQQQKSKTTLQQILVSFSLKKNFRDLGRADGSDPAMMVFYGFRTITIVLVIFLHLFALYVPSPLLNLDYIEKLYRMKIFEMFLHGNLLIDSLFALGGIMVVYQLLSLFETHSINPAFIILKRYIRLTPVYAFAILYIVSVLDNSGTGPLWKKTVVTEVQHCRDNWWTNLLYLNNYINADRMCMVPSWYLPCDFHFFIIGTVICFLISKKKILGFTVLTISIIISILIPATNTWIQSYPAIVRNVPPFLADPLKNHHFLSTYIKSHIRIAPYFLGMFMGYIYYKQKGTNKRLGKAQSWLITILSILIMTASLAGASVFYNPYHEYNRLEAAMYSGLSRSAFTLGALGLFYVASYGFETVQAILSWKPFIPLSKLVYSVYIVHEQFLYIPVGSLRAPWHFTFFNVFSASIPYVVFGYVAALFLYLLIEAPFRRIVNIILAKPKRLPETNGVVLTNNFRIPYN